MSEDRARPLADRVAIVSGGSGALGSHIVTALAEAGCAAVMVGFNTSRASAQRSAADARAAGASRSAALRIPLHSATDVNDAITRVTKEHGRIDILVCAAGVNIDRISWRLDDETWANVIDVNLTGVHRLTRAVAGPMRSAGFGRILVLSSVVGQAGVPGTAAYAASKAGLFGYVRAVASELARSNVTVNALALGYFDGGLLHRVPDEARRELLARIPLGRFGDPRQLGQLVAHLCTAEAEYITGQVINVNGGLVG